MQGDELGMFCDILLKVWKDRDTYCGMYLIDDGYFETDENGSVFDKHITGLTRIVHRKKRSGLLITVTDMVLGTAILNLTMILMNLCRRVYGTKSRTCLAYRL